VALFATAAFAACGGSSAPASAPSRQARAPQSDLSARAPSAKIVTTIVPAGHGMAYGRMAKSTGEPVFEWFADAGTTAKVHRGKGDHGTTFTLTPPDVKTSPDGNDVIPAAAIDHPTMADTIAGFNAQLQARGEPPITGMHFQDQKTSDAMTATLRDEHGKTYRVEPAYASATGHMYWGGCGRIPGPGYPAAYHGSISQWQACSGRYEVLENDPGAFYRGDEAQGNGNGTYFVAFSPAYNLVLGGVENEYSGYGQVMRIDPSADWTGGNCSSQTAGVDYFVTVTNSWTRCPDKIDVEKGLGYDRVRWLGHSAGDDQTRAAATVSVTRFACYCADGYSMNIFADFANFDEAGGVMIHP
jgi:hypothetical protein